MSNTNSHAALLALSLDRSLKQPLHAQLTAALRSIIMTGQLPAGSRLPASRVLAEELSVSRVTVLSAVDQLVSEGYFETRRGAGVFVAGDLADAILMDQHRLEPAAAAPAKTPALQQIRPFQAAIPDHRLFPHRDWARALEKAWRAPEAELLANADPRGVWPLRCAIAEHLKAWRGIDCSPAQIVITCGSGDAVELIARALFEPDELVLLEDPGFPLFRHILKRNGLRHHNCPVDDQGFPTDKLARHHPAAKGCIITPSRQFPLGTTLPLPRRLALLDWAAQTGALIIEDDYDSEFRYRGAPLPSLMSLDKAGATLYIGSFSKLLSSALRIGYLVAPEPLAAKITTIIRETGLRASLVPQPALAQFIATGAFAIHLRRMRRIYGKRQKALLAAIETHLSAFLHADPDPSGMHLICRFKPGFSAVMNDIEAARRAAFAGITVTPLSSYYSHAPTCQAVILGYAGFDEDAMMRAAKTLADAWR